MIKISALNQESDGESGSEIEVTKEALEQIAIQQYAKALELQRKGKIADGARILTDLLDTELLDKIKKPEKSEKNKSSLFNLKYLCYKNVATMQSSLGDIDGAINSYCAAADLDDTDVSLWYRFGLLCFNSQRYDLSLHAFQKGLECNKRHWPSIDKSITLLLGLSYFEDCIAAIHEALILDPDYLRGLVYKKYIKTNFTYVQEYMEYINPKYKAQIPSEIDINDEKSMKLLKEAENINEQFQEQRKADEFKYVNPELNLQKPITKLSWLELGQSFVHMHNYLTDNDFSHACRINLIYEKTVAEEKMDLDETKPTEIVSSENNTEQEKTETPMEVESSDQCDKDKQQEIEKIDSDIETINEQVNPNSTEVKDLSESRESRRNTGRRRGSDLSFLQQWEWCNKRRSGRKKPTTKDVATDNIYEILRKMVPPCLVPETAKRDSQRESSPDTTGLEKLFEEKANPTDAEMLDKQYFGTIKEEDDVSNFIKKYAENKRDIIDLFNEFITILSSKWHIKWPEELPKVYFEANKCYHTHFSIPSIFGGEPDNLDYYKFNLLAEEINLNDKMLNSEDNNQHDLSISEVIGLALVSKPHYFGTDILELTLRHIWNRLHIHLINKNDEFALDCLYQLQCEFQAMGEFHDTYNLHIPNFTYKPNINESEVLSYIKFLERNKRLATVKEMYALGNYEEVLSVLTDTFEFCKNMSKNEEDDMSLDFSIQLYMLVDTYWALKRVDDCLKWSIICLNEALKHYFRYTSSCKSYNNWSDTVVKIVCCFEKIIQTEGLHCLDSLTDKELSGFLENIIRIIGHQVETNASEMPLNTIAPWLIMYYISLREEDLGRRKPAEDSDSCDLPSSLMVLFIGHEQLGYRSWCCKDNAKLLYFMIDTVVPLLRAPLLAPYIDLITQHMEQCVYCLFGYPAKKNKIKYLEDHNVTPQSLDWVKSQQIYEIYKPSKLPELQGKVTAITADSEQLFLKIISLIPEEYDLQKFIPDLEKFMVGKENKLPVVTNPLPYKIRDIYFLVGDYYFKKEEGRLAIKYNMLDILINNKRFESWAQVTLAKAVNLERKLNSCNNINNEKDFLKPAKTILRCFKHTSLLKSNCDLWIEYGAFAYAVHSFCSRLLKLASESLSMEDFESLERQKEEMLETAQKCFTTVTQELVSHNDEDKIHEGMWLAFFMLGKVAEKRGRPPAMYMEHYKKSIKSLHEAEAIYPTKINYSSPQHYSIEVLELHYRIHASILKYIEQHENKPIPTAVGKVFTTYLEEWQTGPFSRKSKKNITTDGDSQSKSSEVVPAVVIPVVQQQAGNILKRSISDAGEDNDSTEAKKRKIEAAKVRRSASYDTERLVNRDSAPSDEQKTVTQSVIPEVETNTKAIENGTNDIDDKIKNGIAKKENDKDDSNMVINKEPIQSDDKKSNEADKNTESSSDSTSSSDSSSSESSSDSSSDSSRDSDSTTSSNENRNLTDEEIMSIISACIEALEDCVSRFPLHYKALYRIAHYYFYFKKGKDVERCRDVMLSNFISKTGSKLTGLFGEKKTTNLFNNIWRIPLSEIDRPGGFANHMNRCVLLTMEILKEIDDHKTLLDLSLQLQRIPDPDKKYLRDFDREELAQQALSLCIQSLKGQLLKFGQQSDLHTNDVEKKAFNSLILDIYRAYQRVQKQPTSKQFTAILVEGFKIITTSPIVEGMNLVDLSMRYCQALIQTLKQQATMASLEKQNTQRRQTSKAIDTSKPSTAITTNLPPTVPQTATITPAAFSKDKVDGYKAATVISSSVSVESSMPSKQSFTERPPVLASTSSMSATVTTAPVKPTSTSSASFFTTSSSTLPGSTSIASVSTPAKTIAMPPVTSLSGTTKYSSKKSTSSNSSSQVSKLASVRKQSNPLSIPDLSLSQYQSLLPMMNEQLLSQQAAALSLSYLNNLSAFAGINALQTPLNNTPNSSQNSFQAEFYRQFLSQGFPQFNFPTTKSNKKPHKYNSRPPSSTTVSSLASKAKSVHAKSQYKTTTAPSISKPSTSVTNVTKSTSVPTIPSMGTVLPTLPASMTANLTSSYNLPNPYNFTPPTSSQNGSHKKQDQTSPSKTLQEKLAERQKSMPFNPSSNSMSLSRLPASLTVTKTSVPSKKPPESTSKLKTDEVIVLDDD